MQQVAVSTASFCLWDVGPEEKLTVCKELGSERVEVAFSTFKMLKEFVSRPFPLTQLAEFKYITIHAPWCGIKYGDNLMSRKIIDYLQQINEKLAVEAFVIHLDTVSDFDWLYKQSLCFYVENALGCGSSQLCQKVINYYNFNSVLDINRATRYGDYLNQIIEDQFDNIKEIHVCGYVNKLGRMPIRESKQVFLLERVKQLHVPFVIEGLFFPGDFA